MMTARAMMKSSTAGFFKKSLVAQGGHVGLRLEGADDALDAEQAPGGNRRRYRAEPHVFRGIRGDVRELRGLHYGVLLGPELVHQPDRVSLPAAQYPPVGDVVEPDEVEPGAAVRYDDVPELVVGLIYHHLEDVRLLRGHVPELRADVLVRAGFYRSHVYPDFLQQVRQVGERGDHPYAAGYGIRVRDDVVGPAGHVVRSRGRDLAEIGHLGLGHVPDRVVYLMCRDDRAAGRVYNEQDGAHVVPPIKALDGRRELLRAESAVASEHAGRGAGDRDLRVYVHDRHALADHCRVERG